MEPRYSLTMLATDRLSRRLENLAVDAVDHHQFRHDADEVLRKAIGYDIASWASVDPATMLFTSCDLLVGGELLAHDPARDQAILALEFAGRDPLTFLSLVQEGRVVARLRAEVDDVDSVERYRNIIAPMGGHDEMRLLLRDKTGVLGSIAMGRADAEFTSDEAAIAGALAATLAGAFRHAFLAAAATGQGSIDRPPGTLTVDRDGKTEFHLRTGRALARHADRRPAPRRDGLAHSAGGDGTAGTPHGSGNRRTGHLPCLSPQGGG